MSTDRAFVTYLLELLAPFDGVTAKRMFGGYGLRREGINFAIVADDVLYLKTDTLTQTQFETYSLKPFEYQSKGRAVRLSYWQVPEECLESPAAMRVWCELAWTAALRTAQHPKNQRRRSARMKS